MHLISSLLVALLTTSAAHASRWEELGPTTASDRYQQFKSRFEAQDHCEPLLGSGSQKPPTPTASGEAHVPASTEPLTEGELSLSDLLDPQKSHEFYRQLRAQLNLHSQEVSQAFESASSRADESLDAIKRSLTDSRETEGQNLLNLFGEFNDIADRLSPPAEFTSADAARSAQEGLKGLLRGSLKRLGRRVSLPPTVEQWLALYASEMPNFSKMHDQVHRAIQETQRRTTAAHDEIQVLHDLLETKNAELEGMKALADQIEQKMAAAQTPSQRQEIESLALIPVLEEIASTQEYINAHSLILAQKVVILASSEKILAEMLRTVSIAVPTLRQASVAADDALFFKQMTESTERLRKLTAQSIQTTSRLIKSSVEANNRLAASSVISSDHLRTAVQDLASAVRQADEAVHRQLPSLQARIDEHAALNQELEKIRESRTTPIPQVTPPNPQ